MFRFGDIVLARFPFTDLSGDKRRPVLVVSHRNEQRLDLVVCFITSTAQSGVDSAIIDASPGTGLKVPSIVRFDKIATLDRSVFTGRIGEAPADWLASHAPIFLGVFGFLRLD